MPLNLPYSINLTNPVPVDGWSGPYTASNINDAITLANYSIPIPVRFISLEVRLIVDNIPYKYWYYGGTDSNNLVPFNSPLNLTTIGNSGSSTFSNNILNIPTYTLSGLGGQPLLDGTNSQFVKGDGSFDNSFYITQSSINYLTATLSNYYLTSNPASYITASSLIPYATTATLSNYYLSSNPSGYITASSVDGVEYQSNKDTPNGYAGLDGNGLIPTSILPDSVVGNVKYKGTFDPITTTFSATASNLGWYYISTNSATYSNLFFQVGDWMISEGTYLSKVANTDAVMTVNGRMGNVVINSSDITSAGGALTATLSNYYLNSNPSGYITASSLTPYALSATLSNYALTSTLSNYYLNSNPSGYITASSLIPYALTGTLSNYLPLIGGTISINLQVNGTASTNTLLSTNDIIVNGINIGNGPGSTTQTSIFGYQSGLSMSTGNTSYNTFFGYQSGRNLISGVSNAFFGPQTGYYMTLGSRNMFIGPYSGYFLGRNVYGLTSSDNIMIGFYSGIYNSILLNNTQSNNCIFIGSNTYPLNTGDINEIIIGYQSVGLGSNTTVIGNSSTTITKLFGNVLLGTSVNNLGGILQTAGNIVPSTNTTYNLGSTSYQWNNIYSNKFISNGGSSSQFLKADGSLDSNTYLTSGGASGSYQPLNTNLTSISGLTYSSLGFVKMYGSGTFSLDTNTYLTANQSISFSASGDISGSASGTTNLSPTLTLATITQSTGSSFVKISLDTKGRVIGNTTVGTSDLTSLLSSSYLSLTGGDLTGTVGSGFIGFISQSATPSTPSSGFRLFANSSSRFSWIGANGYVITFDGTSNTANRVYTLPDRNITFDNITTSSTTNGTGFLKGNGSNISFDNSTYLTANQTITLSGAITGSGTTSISTTLANSIVGISNLSATGSASSTTYLRGDNTWATPTGLISGLTSGQVAFANSPSTITGNINFTFNNSTGVLSLNNGSNFSFRTSNNTQYAGWDCFDYAGNQKLSIAYANNGTGNIYASKAYLVTFNSTDFSFILNSIEQMRMFSSTGNFLFQNGGTYTDNGVDKLQVTGSITATSHKVSGGTSSQFQKGDGSLDTNTYLTNNQTITLSGAVTGSGSTSIATTLASSIVGISNLTATGTASSTTYLRGDNTWATPTAISAGQVAFGNGTSTGIKGVPGLTWDQTNNQLSFSSNYTTSTGTTISNISITTTITAGTTSQTLAGLYIKPTLNSTNSPTLFGVLIDGSNIATGSNNYTLKVNNGASFFNGNVTILSSSSPNLYISNNTNATISIGVTNGNTPNYGFISGGNTYPFISINASAGNVGIGTTIDDGTNKLQVAGSTKTNSLLVNAGRLTNTTQTLTVTSNAVTMDCSLSNYFTITLGSSATTTFTIINIPTTSQTITVQVTTGTSSLVSFPSTVKQPAGASYVPTTTASSIDILTFVTLGNGNLYLVNTKNLS